MHQRAWDFFSTYTFRHDVSLKRSENLMLRLEASLKEQQLEHTLFWVAEFQGAIDKPTCTFSFKERVQTHSSTISTRLVG